MKVKIADTLHTDNIFIHSTLTDKDEILALMADSFKIAESAADPKKAIIEREAKMSTGLKHGVALPHARLPLPGFLRMAILTTELPVEYESLDDKPVDIFIMVLCSDSATMTSTYLSFMGHLSIMFGNIEFREKIRQCKTPQEVYTLLTS